MNRKQLLIGTGFLSAAATAGVFAYFSTKKTIPKGVTAIDDFELDKYLGKWFEVARLDMKWEKNLKNVTAEYLLDDNNNVQVINSGYDTAEEKQKETVGKAKLAGPENMGMLKVSFFGPFSAGYNILSVDQDYKYALVCGENRDALWLLSRGKEMSQRVKDKYKAIAKEYGFDTQKLVWTEHD